ncbi:MAG: hypothetical protein ACI9K2_006840, partial [Myxococcota bacterium]
MDVAAGGRPVADEHGADQRLDDLGGDAEPV